jgi:hypothetical protein
MDEGRDALCWNVVNLSAKKRPNILNNIGEWHNIAYVSERGYKNWNEAAHEYKS